MRRTRLMRRVAESTGVNVQEGLDMDLTDMGKLAFSQLCCARTSTGGAV